MNANMTAQKFAYFLLRRSDGASDTTVRGPSPLGSLLFLSLVGSVLLSTGCGGGGNGSSASVTQSGINVSVSPSLMNVQAGTTQQFTATVSGTSDTTVTWQVNGVTGGNSTVGTISSSGLYQAPSTVPSTATVTITAVSNADSSKTSSASVTITSQVSGNSVPAQFFGLHFGLNVGPPPEPWPSVPFGTTRSTGTLTFWGLLNPGDGSYDWTNLDAWLSKIQQEASQSPTGGYDAIYTFYGTPAWASSNPNQVCSTTLKIPLGACEPPNDLNADGSGANKHWQDFVTAVVTHVHQDFPGIIKYWEVWNEPNELPSWRGTIPQLVRMAKDATTIIKGVDPSAQIATPCPVSASQADANITVSPSDWLQQYLPAAAAQGVNADIVAFHGYVLQGAVEEAATTAENVATVKNSVPSLSTKPIWDTEAGFRTAVVPDEDDQAAWLARFYLIQLSRGIQRAYWYRWDDSKVGWLWDPTSGIRKPGLAYGEVFKWLVGNTLSTPCSSNGSVWTCGFTKQGSNYQALAVWDASQSCGSGTCTTSGYTPDGVYINYRDLEGNLTSFTPGSMIQIGAKPILLENQ